MPPAPHGVSMNRFHIHSSVFIVQVCVSVDLSAISSATAFVFDWLCTTIVWRRLRFCRGCGTPTSVAIRPPKFGADVVRECAAPTVGEELHGTMDQSGRVFWCEPQPSAIDHAALTSFNFPNPKALVSSHLMSSQYGRAEDNRWGL